MYTYTSDVVIIGAGHAAMCAAHAARERGAEVIMLEAAPVSALGGNSFFTAGAIRTVHHGLTELAELVDEDPRHSRTEVPPYSAAEFTEDLERVTEGRNDPAMTSTVVTRIAADLHWLKDKGMGFRLLYERQAYERADGSFLFWGGLHIGHRNGGAGLIAEHVKIAQAAGVQIHPETQAVRLIKEHGAIRAVLAQQQGEKVEYRASAIILGSGGFESSADLRAEYLGPQWRNAVVRGTAFNTGTMLEEALRLGAARAGDWGSCHATQWDAEYPDNESNYEVTNRLTRQSYPLGILVNREGQRFLDEGADFRNLTYARYGKEVLNQPGSIAWQIYDAELRPLLRSEEYDLPGVGMYQANSWQELAAAAGIDAEGLRSTVEDFNGSIREDQPFDPTIKDCRAAATQPPKSNWANALETPPFYAYPVTCGITFTFGGLAGDANAQVLDTEGFPIPGLFVCGEALGGLFSGNYPGGSGLAAGTVFGRISGDAAARRAAGSGSSAANGGAAAEDSASRNSTPSTSASRNSTRG